MCLAWTYRFVPVCFSESIVGNFARLGESIHTLGYFDLHVVIVNFVLELVLLHDRCGNVADGESHDVFILCHGCVQVKILDFHGHELRSGCR